MPISNFMPSIVSAKQTTHARQRRWQRSLFFEPLENRLVLSGASLSTELLGVLEDPGALVGEEAPADSRAKTELGGEEIPMLSKMSVTLPDLPQQFIDTTWDPAYDRAADIIVRAGDNLQAALDAAQQGQIIELEAGATFVGNFQLRNNAGNDWIYIRSSRYDELPGPGNRIGPEHAHLMPKIVSHPVEVNVPTLDANYSAHHYRLVGIEFSTNTDDQAIVRLGTETINWLDTGAQTVNQLPHHIIFDRVYIHGKPQLSVVRGIELNARHAAVVDSYISEIHHHGRDSQAILGYNAGGPLKITNNYLEAAGENVMFGGAEPHITNLLPSDIEIRGNHFSKPLAWKNPIPSGAHAGQTWNVKNLLELKNAQRVLIEGNLFEHNWPHAQNGFAILFTVRNEYGGAPWSAVQDITFRNNIVRDSYSFLNISSSDNNYQSQQTQRILVENNLVYDMDHRHVQIVTPGQGYPPVLDLTIRHNTMLHRGTGNAFLTVDGATVAEDFTFVDNIVTHGSYGFHFPFGNINNWLINYDFQNNVIVSGNANVPAGNTILNNINRVGFVDVAADDYRLSDSSPFKNAAADGTDVGRVASRSSRP